MRFRGAGRSDRFDRVGRVGTTKAREPHRALGYRGERGPPHGALRNPDPNQGFGGLFKQVMGKAVTSTVSVESEQPKVRPYWFSGPIEAS